MNQTESILDKYLIPEIRKLVLDYAFKYKYKNELFILGYYEECIELIERYTEIIKSYQYVMVDTYNAFLNTVYKLSCRGGHRSIINYIEKKYMVNLNQGLIGSCRGGHIILAKEFINKGAIISTVTLSQACLSKNLELVKYIVEYSNYHWTSGLYLAYLLMLHFTDCTINTDTIKYVAKKVKENFCSTKADNIIHVCITGDINLVTKYIAKHKVRFTYDNIRLITWSAILSKNIKFIKYIITLLKNNGKELDLKEAFFTSLFTNIDIVKFIYDLINNSINGIDIIKNQLNFYFRRHHDPLNNPIDNWRISDIDILKFVVDLSRKLNIDIYTRDNFCAFIDSNIDMFKIYYEEVDYFSYEEDIIFTAFEYANFELIDDMLHKFNFIYHEINM